MVYPMSQRRPSNTLHLQDLSIAGFRGIKDLSIGRLRRVTLIAGRNGVGKTTVLDAVRVFATRGRHSVLSVLLRGRDELIAADDADEKMPAPDFAALFHGRSPGDVRIAIGPSNRHDQVMIEEVALRAEDIHDGLRWSDADPAEGLGREQQGCGNSVSIPGTRTTGEP